MPSNSDKWIRSIKDNTSGKVVTDPAGNRWEWQTDDETSHLLKKLGNVGLAIESTDLHPKIERTGASTDVPKRRRPLNPGARDSGGGFNPYDHAGKKKR
jgi:hypothetical protein